MAKALSSSRASVSEQQQDYANFKTTAKSRYDLEISARLFKTSGGKYIVGVEEYDKTNEQYEVRFAEVATTLKELGELLQAKGPGVDDDILCELFEKTEIADQFVEQID